MDVMLPDVSEIPWVCGVGAVTLDPVCSFQAPVSTYFISVFEVPGLESEDPELRRIEIF
jgi:hypothetical protein